jgi:pimeloyl-ACP methyl ester carboxylesterase
MGCALLSQAQELPRRSFLGTRLEKVTDDVQRVMELPSAKGALVTEVFPNSTAEQAGFKKGDVILKINGTEVNSPAEAVKAVANHPAGEKFSYEIRRDKKTIAKSSTFKALALEKYKDFEMEYKAVQTDNGVQRLIISKPKTNTKVAAFVFIGGIGCYSLDNPLDTNRSETQLLNRLTRAGYACVRAEKPGMGDNVKCKKCEEVSFMEETAGYVAAIKKLKTFDYIDSNKIFILGHSMGGVFAPLIAQQTNIKGIISYGTIGSNFIEYLNKTRRTIGEAYKWSPDEIDAYVKESCECAGYFFVEKMTAAEATKKNEACKEYLNVFEFRSRKYNDELYAINIPQAWKPFAGKALFLWGSADYVSAKEDHEILTKTVNYFHPGQASFVEVKNSDHDMLTAGSFQEARNNTAPYSK